MCLYASTCQDQDDLHSTSFIFGSLDRFRRTCPTNLIKGVEIRKSRSIFVVVDIIFIECQGTTRERI